MSGAGALFNAYSPACAVNPCLRQVAGYVDSNPLAQVSACVSMFGSPVVTTIQPTEDIVFVTDTASVSYTDIIVSPTIEVSTVDQTATSVSQVIETTTVYSSTIVQTVTATVTTGAAPTGAKKRRRRGHCGRASGASSVITSTSSDSTASSNPTASSDSTASPSSTSTPLFPIAYNCPSLEEYSSACACITAVATTESLTAPAATWTSTVDTTVSVDTSSTSMSTVISVETSTVDVTITTTIPQTIVTAITSTSTVTVTSYLLAPTQTSLVVIGSGEYRYDVIAPSYVNQVGSTVAYVGSQTAPLVGVAVDGGQPWLVDSSPQANLYTIWPGVDSAQLAFVTDAAAATAFGHPVVCTVSGIDGRLLCSSSSGYKDITDIQGCDDSYLTLSTPDNESGCTPQQLYLVTLTLQDGTVVQLPLPSEE